MKISGISITIGLIIGLLIGAPLGWFLAPTAPPAQTVLKTAGSTTVYPLSVAWSTAYFPASSYTVKIEVSAGGSGYGRTSTVEGSVDFGATSSYKDPTAYGAATNDQVITIPVALDALAVVVNDALNASGMSLTREHCIAIFQGNVTTWPGLVAWFDDISSIDATGAINMYHRSDASGTTATFTGWLDEAPSGNWTLGDDELINWPIGTGAEGNPGVQSGVAADTGGIGYVGFAFTDGITMVTLWNEGNSEWVVPSPEAAKLAVPSGYDPSVALFDSTISGAYPIARTIYYLVNTDPPVTSFLRVQHGLVSPVGVRTETEVFLQWAVSSTGGQQHSIIRDEVGYLELTGTAAATYAQDAIDDIAPFLPSMAPAFVPMALVWSEK